MNKNATMSALAGCLLAGLAACGGSGNDEPAPVVASKTTGVLLDAAVSGVDYSSASYSGSTSAKGEFDCKAGESLTFKLGDITLGTAACGTVLTPMDLAGVGSASDDKVINRLLFLQSLDEDANPANGIQIAAAVKAALAGKALDFGKSAADFGGALQAVLPALTDKMGDKYSDRAVDDTARKAALEHFESSLADVLGRSDTSLSAQSPAGMVKITKTEVFAPDALHVPYEGKQAATKKDFPNGFYPAAGSGLAFKGKTADGTLEFYALTDRGPNGDGPSAPAPGNPATMLTSKIFPAPSFVPSVGIITVGKNGGAQLKSLTPLSVSAGVKASGRPFDAAAVGFSGEVPLNDTLVYDAAKGGYDVNGIDPEAIVNDTARGVLWASDEYGPFIVKIDPATGRILKKYQPGTAATDLPAVLAKRRPNRGMEGLTLDVASGKLHGFLQSPIDDGKATPPGGKSSNVRDLAAFIRWLEFDPATETSKMYAYPVDGTLYDKARTGNAKLGDVVSLGGGKFIVIEQGKYADGKVHNVLMLVEIPATATDIVALGSDLEKSSITAAAVGSANYANVVTLKKSKLFDLNAAGWVAEKAEGLALVDDSTLALINDNDFGLRSVLLDANGKFVEGSLEDCTVDAAGAIVSGCPAGVTGARLTRGLPAERATRLWQLKFPQKLSSYSVLK